MSDNFKLDLDPRKVLDALKEMGSEMKDFARSAEESLGKDAAKSLVKLEEAAERGTTKISAFFKNMGKQVREDLKTAFDATGILAGAKFAKDIGEGVKSVFDMERAFDRLQTRLKMTKAEFNEFKNSLGRTAAGTGQKLEDVLPGVEAAAARGGVKNPAQLTAIGEMLGKVKATTGESTEGLADTVVEILRTQGRKVNAQSFKEVLDAMQATRTSGAFKGAGEAGAAIEQLSPYANRLGLNTRQLGGLAAQASQAGSAGQDILRQVVERAADPIQRKFLQATLGQDIVKGGKLNVEALGKINTQKFSGMTGEQFGQLTGFQGANGGDFVRFVQAFKQGNEQFKAVLQGSDEVSSQFRTATDNLASGIDQFREKTKEAGREIGEGLSQMSRSLMKGDFSGAMEAGKSTLKSAYENKGTLGAATAATAAIGLLSGGAINRLLGKLGGAGGLGAGILKGELAKQAGVQPVYVTNAAEISGGKSGTMVEDFLSKTSDIAMGGAKRAGGLLGKLGKFGGALGVGGAVAGVGYAGYEAGSALANNEHVTDPLFEKISKAFDFGGVQAAQKELEETQARFAAKRGGPGGEEHAALTQAVATGIERGMARATVKVEQKGGLTNPSAVTGRGGAR